MTGMIRSSALMVLVAMGFVIAALAFGAVAAEAAGLPQSVAGALVQEEHTDSEEQSSEDNAEEDDTDEETDETDSSEDATDETDEESPSPVAPLPTETPSTEETPTDLPTETGSTDRRAASPLGWLLLGGGVLTAGAAYAVYRRGV